ncbi:unnamed protein product [Meganyctiphanes norvegica]|uniref:PHD-type domain-containing protein n=1 Tax=Meganyctiphanes norvegica TaxID=48144 RepID=A0AAV2SJR3_MEGNR
MAGKDNNGITKRRGLGDAAASAKPLLADATPLSGNSHSPKSIFDGGACGTTPSDKCPCGKSSKQNMIQCDICSSWYHYSCVSLSTTHGKALGEMKTVPWYCRNCSQRITLTPLSAPTDNTTKSLLNEVINGITNLSGEMKEMKEEMKEMKDGLAGVAGEVKEFRDEFKLMKDTVSNLTSRMGDLDSRVLSIENQPNLTNKDALDAAVAFAGTKIVH